MADPTSLLEWLDHSIARAEQDYTIHTGHQSACELHKSGRVTGGLKYAEGRLVALTALHRRVRKPAPGDPAALAELLAAEHARWQQLLQTHQHAERPSLPWVAYAQGGVDALAQCLAFCTEQT
jgi:hypothetical protein